MPAEWVRHWRDNSNFADAICESVAASCLADSARDLTQRHEVGHPTDDLLEGHDNFRRPDAIFFQRHEFDETDDDILFAGEAAKGGNLVIVEAAHEDAIDLHRT